MSYLINYSFLINIMLTISHLGGKKKPLVLGRSLSPEVREIYEIPDRSVCYYAWSATWKPLGYG